MSKTPVPHLRSDALPRQYHPGVTETGMLLTPMGRQKISDLINGRLVGTEIYDRNGLEFVEATRSYAPTPVLTLALDDDTTLEGTPDLEVMALSPTSDYGEWRKLSTLQASDQIAKCVNTSPQHAPDLLWVPISKLETLKTKTIYAIRTTMQNCIINGILVRL